MKRASGIMGGVVIFLSLTLGLSSTTLALKSQTTEGNALEEETLYSGPWSTPEIPQQIAQTASKTIATAISQGTFHPLMPGERHRVTLITHPRGVGDTERQATVELAPEEKDQWDTQIQSALEDLKVDSSAGSPEKWSVAVELHPGSEEPIQVPDSVGIVLTPSEEKASP